MVCKFPFFDKIGFRSVKTFICLFVSTLASSDQRQLLPLMTSKDRRVCQAFAAVNFTTGKIGLISMACLSVAKNTGQLQNLNEVDPNLGFVGPAG